MSFGERRGTGRLALSKSEPTSRVSKSRVLCNSAQRSRLSRLLWLPVGTTQFNHQQNLGPSRSCPSSLRSEPPLQVCGFAAGGTKLLQLPASDSLQPNPSGSHQLKPRAAVTPCNSFLLATPFLTACICPSSQAASP